MRVLATPLILRAVLPALGATLLFILLALGITKAFWPRVDTNGWPFIAVVMPLACVACFAAWAVGHVSLVRWLIRYRSARHGREVAMGDVLRAGDGRPSRWRRLELAAYGVSESDRVAFSHANVCGAGTIGIEEPPGFKGGWT
jgi:hypothetical protein